ncbi:precorrin-6A synthase (deacetylating) [Amycolatopsis lurida]|uniref:Precorrin 6A synthase n=1 Tax=Amycolatopsis lurida NRRL 2430 TaxID=1460371 RepID=A0A2P2FR48_AMYLU|nr:precorrin-6A synthase (deacetylating) [Amycolatopsis lurida]KFU79150.1 precorrin 6A synthase [Amycolatopsis lurida NRRL 2430]SEC98995.1 precorrin-6A synthase (deacetylating) [Amycolatopsis lurida]
MRKISAIGIGAGDPDHLTVQAIRRLNETDVFFVLDKGSEKQDLTALRQEILDRFVERPGYRVVRAPDPARDRTPDDYRKAVADWHRLRTDVYENMIASLGPGERGAFLVWGDPALYDSTLTLLDAVLARGTVEFEYDVIPGVSSVAALTSRHRTTMNQIGRPVQITTGRRLEAGWPADVDDVFVMLDANCTFSHFADTGLEIYWGAYLGTPDELLLSGPLSAELAAEIRSIRASARSRKGWIMDIYHLRRPVHP